MTYYEISIGKANPLRGTNNVRGDKAHIRAVPLYVHLFSTSPISIRNRTELNTVYSEMKRAFPSPAFQIRVMKINSKAEVIRKKELDAEIQITTSC